LVFKNSFADDLEHEIRTCLVKETREDFRMSTVKLGSKDDKSGTPACVMTHSNAMKDGLDSSSKENEKISSAEKSHLQRVINRSLVENHHGLEIQRKDPNSRLYSAKTFEAMNL